MIALVPLTVSDASLLVAIGAITIIESHGHSASPETMQEYVGKNFNKEACQTELMDDKNIFYAVFYNDQPAGYSKIIFNSSHPAAHLKPITKLERLYVLKEFYGLKLGQLLMQQAIDMSKEQGDRGMWLNVWKKNERAIQFYEKQGFETIGESEFMLTAKHSNPNWVMLRRY
jgi:ribosomal protein S18 acetylase RimI-like enzyme